MLWTTLGFAVLGLWAMLAVFGGEHRRRIQEQEALEQAEAAEAARKPRD